VLIKISKIAAIPEILVLWRSQEKSISAKKKWSQAKFEFLACLRAINSKTYPFYYYLFLPVILIKFILPYSFKKFLRKTIFK